MTDSNQVLPRRVFFTVVFIACSRFLHLAPISGVDVAKAQEILPSLGLFTGNVLGPSMVLQAPAMTLMLVGFGPTFTASIMVQLMSSPLLEPLKDAWLISELQYARLTFDYELLARFQQRFTSAAAFVIGCVMAFSMRGVLLPNYRWFDLVTPIAAGGAMVAWFCEIITDNGIGQGMGVMLSLSILNSLTGSLRQLASSFYSGALSLPKLSFILAFLGVITFGSVLLQYGVSKVPIAYFQNEQSALTSPHLKDILDEHVPVRVNPSGMMPVLLTMYIMELPKHLFVLLQWQSAHRMLTLPWIYYPLYFLLTFMFNFMDLENGPKNMHEYLMKVGARVPGVRPGKQTIAMLKKTQIMARFWGGIMLALLVTAAAAIDNYVFTTSGIMIGYTSIMIVVGTIMSAKRQVQAFRKLPQLSKVIDEMKGGL